MGITDTTETVLKECANRIRSYSTDGGAKVSDYTANVYIDFEPADAPLPHILLSKGFSETDGEFHDQREMGDLDIVVRGRGRQDATKVQALADIVTQALVSYPTLGTADNGLLRVTTVQRGRIGFVDTPTEDELIELPLVASYFAWPALLSDALT